jgi:hypothetical protein
MPRLRPPKQQESDIQKPFDSSMLTPKEEEPLHDNEEVVEAAPEEKPVKVKEPEVVKQEEEKKEDPALALQKQLDELKKSEEIQRNEVIQARQREEQKDRELRDARKRAEESQRKVVQADYQTITTGLEAAKERLESAKRDLRMAETTGDIDAKIEAQDRLADSKYDFRTYQNAKIELDERFEAEKAAPKVEPQQGQPKQPTVEQNIDSWNLPDITTKYLKAHQDYLRDPVRFNELRYWNDRAAKAGLTVHTQPYLDYVEEKMNPPEEEKPEKQEQQRTNIVSAPVSREVPSSSGTKQSGKITLTKDQQEAARISGVTETEYARNLVKMNEAKANGQYTGGQ